MSLKLESWSSKTYSYTLPTRYKVLGSEESDTLVLCLHGYQDHALSMMKRIGWWNEATGTGADLPFQVLAVNAPFPVPIWTKTGFLEAYAWYFRDTDRGFTIVSPQQTAERVCQLIDDLALAGRPTVIFGFSQGAYLAPFIGRQIGDLRAFVSVGSGYPPEPYKQVKKSAKIFAIHGDRDLTIPLAASQEAHGRLLQSGFNGEFFVIPELDHKIDAQIEPLVRRLIEENLS